MVKVKDIEELPIFKGLTGDELMKRRTSAWKHELPLHIIPANHEPPFHPFWFI